jgi:hypothetical protein
MTTKVTLVHGTFARGAKWADPSRSKLCAHLSQAVTGDIVFDTWKWSGRNSHRHRVLAAQELASHLEACSRAFPNDRHFVIAHSHGGTVLSLALAGSHEARDYVAGSVFLATPFIHCGIRPYARFLLFNALFVFAIIPVLLALLAGAFLLSILLFGMFVPGLAMFLGSHGARLIRALTLETRSISSGLTPRLESWLQRIKQQMNVSGLVGERCLFVRTAGDEASAALSTASLVNRVVSNVSTLLGHTLSRINPWVLVLICFVYLVAATANEYVFWSMAWVFCTWVLLTFSLTVAAISVSVVLQRAFGMHLGWRGVFLDFSVESTPPGHWEIYTSSYAAESTKGSVPLVELYHSKSYESQDCLSYIAGWLQNRIN